MQVKTFSCHSEQRKALQSLKIQINQQKATSDPLHFIVK